MAKPSAISESDDELGVTASIISSSFSLVSSLSSFSTVFGVTSWSNRDELSVPGLPIVFANGSLSNGLSSEEKSKALIELLTHSVEH